VTGGVETSAACCVFVAGLSAHAANPVARAIQSRHFIPGHLVKARGPPAGERMRKGLDSRDQRSARIPIEPSGQRYRIKPAT